VQLQSIGLEIPIGTIYNKVKFAADLEIASESVAEAGAGSDQPG
jgi:hypothetical protein